MHCRTSAMRTAAAVFLGLAFTPPPTSAQTVRGILLDLETERPVDLGLVHLLTQSGDSVTSTLTNQDGYFSLASSEPGSFYLLASAWGYRTTPAGVFELGEDGEMTVEFRIRPEPLRIDEILIDLRRPTLEHKLIRRGFVDRFQRGLGIFLTPHDIEESMARSTEALFEGLPGLRVAMGRTGGGIPVSYVGEQILMWSPTMSVCAPSIFVDGRPVQYRPIAPPETPRAELLKGLAVSLSTLVPLETVDAVEVYWRPAEVPAQFSGTQNRGQTPGIASGTCGAIVFWTKSR